MATAPVGRRERRKLEVRTRIVEAAGNLFGDQGFHDTTVSQICQGADVAHKTFFNHFPAKREVMTAIAAHALDELIAVIDVSRSNGASTHERLRLFFDEVATRLTGAPPMHRELVTEIIHAAQESDADSDQAQRLHRAFGRIVRDGLRGGDVTRAHPASTLTEMILGAYYSLMFSWTNIDGYPVARRASASAKFLGDAFAPGPNER